MSLNLDTLKDAPRLLIEADLQPLQGSRFYPTNFPGLGAASYDGPDGSRMLLVESNQSVANRLENVCWDSAAADGDGDWVAPLRGLPYVQARTADGKILTNSVLEAHRINSEYIARADGIEPVKDAIGYDPKRPFDVRAQLVPALLRFDPNALLHGVFLEEWAGVIRLPRSLSGFIEARDINVAQSGGVKFNRVEPGLKEGEGNVPYSRDDYTAASITAYFNLDLAQIHAFGLGDAAEQLLIALSLYKVRRFLDTGLHLRSACDLEVIDQPRVKRPDGFDLPGTDQISAALPGLIQAVTATGQFAQPPVTVVTPKASGKKK